MRCSICGVTGSQKYQDKYSFKVEETSVHSGSYNNYDPICRECWVVLNKAVESAVMQMRSDTKYSQSGNRVI